MDRRRILAGALGLAAAAPAAAALRSDAPIRASLDAGARGLVAGSPHDQSRLLQALLREASDEDRPLHLPAGRFVVSKIVLPQRTRIAGVPGATVLVFGGDGHMVSADGAAIVALSGLAFDGGGLPLDDYAPALVHLAGVEKLAVEDCAFLGSAKSGLAVDRSAGRIERSVFGGAREAGLRVIESTGMLFAGNTIHDCGNGGILVWRWSEGEDGTIVANNRIARIAAEAGGTGENGNGINVFRAGGVIVADNVIADCAFSAIRANAADNVQITGNACRNSGEVGVFVEFAFEGAVVSGNLVDGAANGISIANYREGGRIAVVSGNVVRNLVTHGPYPADAQGFGVGVAVEADAAVTGNVIDGAPRFGLVLGWGPYLRDIAATGNVIRGAAIGVAVSAVEGVGSALIADNLIAGAEHGIVAMRWADALPGDLAIDGAATWPHVTLGTNRVTR